MSIGINQQKESELQGPLSTIIGTSFLILLRPHQMHFKTHRKGIHDVNENDKAVNELNEQMATGGYFCFSFHCRSFYLFYTNEKIR